jgi:hypothetical protein
MGGHLLERLVEEFAEEPDVARFMVLRSGPIGAARRAEQAGAAHDGLRAEAGEFTQFSQTGCAVLVAALEEGIGGHAFDAAGEPWSDLLFELLARRPTGRKEKKARVGGAKLDLLSAVNGAEELPGAGVAAK